MRFRETDSPGTDRLPPELTDGLRSMIRRVRRIILVRGIMTSLVALFACSLAIMAVDAGVTIVSSAVRWLLSTAALAIVLATAWHFLARPLLQPLTLTRMARVLETRHPELQERISSAIELLGMGGNASATGSEQLIQLLARDAQVDMGTVMPRREFTGRSLKPVVWSAAIILVVFGLLFAAWPEQTSLLFVRAVAPHLNLADLQGGGLEVEPGDVLRMEGDDLTLRLTVKGRAPMRAELHTEREAGLKSSERMIQVSPEGEDPARYELYYPSVTRSFRYRMRYGAGLTRYYDVTVLPPPAVTHKVITCHYPEYTDRPDLVLPDGASDIAGVEGGRVTIRADFNRKIDGVLLLGDQRLNGTPGDMPGATWTFNLSTNMPDRWALSLQDEHGFTNRLEWAVLKVEPDRAPVVDLQRPRSSKLVLPPYGLLAFACSINEDFGLATSDLVIDPQGFNTEIQRRPLAVTQAGGEYWSGRGGIEMGLLNLGGSRSFKVWISVTDSRPARQGGPQEAKSRIVEVALDATAPRIEDQLRAEQKKDMIDMLRKAAEQLTLAAGQVAEVQEKTVVELLPPAVVEVLTAAQDNAAGAVELMKAAVRVAMQSRFAHLAPRIVWTGREVVEPARAQTAEISVVEPEKRREQSATAITALRNAADLVLALIGIIEEADAALAEIARIEALSDREKSLSARARKEMTPEEKKAWREEQAKVAKALAAEKDLDKDAAEKAQKQMEAAQEAMLKAEKELADKQDKAAGSKPKDSDAKDGKAKAKQMKNAKSKKGKGKGQGKTGKSKGKGKDTKGKDGKGKGKKGSGGKPTPGNPPQEEAAESAAKAAKTMAEMAEQMEAKKMPPSKASPKSIPSMKGGNARGKGTPFNYVPGSFSGPVPGADWARVKGESSAGALADELQDVPAEYRELVRRYFIELAGEDTGNEE